jgi:hypothetical protein
MMHDGSWIVELLRPHLRDDLTSNGKKPEFLMSVQLPSQPTWQEER